MHEKRPKTHTVLFTSLSMVGGHPPQDFSLPWEQLTVLTNARESDLPPPSVSPTTCLRKSVLFPHAADTGLEEG